MKARVNMRSILNTLPGERLVDKHARLERYRLTQLEDAFIEAEYAAHWAAILYEGSDKRTIRSRVLRDRAAAAREACESARELVEAA